MEYEGKPFSDVLREIEGGRFVDDLTRDLRKVVNAVLETRNAGMLAITIKVVPTGRGSIEVDAFSDIAKRITEQAGVAVYLGSV